MLHKYYENLKSLWQTLIYEKFLYIIRGKGKK